MICCAYTPLTNCFSPPKKNLPFSPHKQSLQLAMNDAFWTPNDAVNICFCYPATFHYPGGEGQWRSAFTFMLPHSLQKHHVPDVIHHTARQARNGTSRLVSLTPDHLLRRHMRGEGKKTSLRPRRHSSQLTAQLPPSGTSRLDLTPDHLYSLKFKDRRRMVGGSNSLSLSAHCATQCMMGACCEIVCCSLAATRYLQHNRPTPEILYTWRCFPTSHHSLLLTHSIR